MVGWYQSVFASNMFVVDAARNREVDAFRKIVFSPLFLDTIINQMDTNEKIFNVILADLRIREAFTDYLARTGYDDARETAG